MWERYADAFAAGLNKLSLTPVGGGRREPACVTVSSFVLVMALAAGFPPRRRTRGAPSRPAQASRAQRPAAAQPPPAAGHAGGPAGLRPPFPRPASSRPTPA